VEPLGLRGASSSPTGPSSSIRRSPPGDLLDVVDHGEELPLRVDLAPAAQREAPHPLVLEIREDWFHRAHPPAVALAPLPRVKLPPHAIDGAISLVRVPCAFSTFDDADRSLHGALGMTQALRAQWAVAARRDRRLEMRDSISVEQQMLAAVVQLVTRGANTERSSFVIEEVFDAEELRLLRK